MSLREFTEKSYITCRVSIFLKERCTKYDLLPNLRNIQLAPQPKISTGKRNGCANSEIEYWWQDEEFVRFTLWTFCRKCTSCFVVYIFKIKWISLTKFSYSNQRFSRKHFYAKPSTHKLVRSSRILVNTYYLQVPWEDISLETYVEYATW